MGLYRSAKDFNPGRFDDYKELMAFYEGNQDELTAFVNDKPWVISMNTPYSSLAIDTRVASLQASDYKGKLQPLSPEDVEDTQLLQQLVDNQWDALQMDDKVSDALHRAAIARESYIHITFDPDKIKGGTGRLQKGALEAYFLDPGSILIDPKALNMKEADYLVVMGRISPEMAKELYGFTPKNEEEVTAFAPSERGEVYLGNDYDSEQDDVLTKLTFYERKGSKIRKTIMIEGKIVEEGRDIEIATFPIAQLRWEKKAGSPYGISLMDRLLPEQKAINSIESATVNSVLSTVAPQYVVRKDSGLDPKLVATFNGAPGVVYAVNGDPTSAVVPLITPKIDQQILEIKREYEVTIDKISSRTDQFQGNIGTAGNTAGGANAAINRATVIEQKFLRNMEEFIQDITEILVEFITKGMKGKKVYTRSEQKANGEYDFGQLQVKNNLSSLEYTFSIDLEIKTQYSRDKEKSLLLELFQFERQYDAPVKSITVKDILKAYDVSNREELVQRYDDLVSKDEATKARLIAQFSKVAAQSNVPDEQVQQGITEIMAGKETPTVDSILQEIQAQRQEMAQMEQQMQQDEMERTKSDLDNRQKIEQQINQAAGGSPMMPQM